MKNLFIISAMFCLFGCAMNQAKACSPSKPTLASMIESYNAGAFLLVQGYFEPPKEGIFSSNFVVTRSSDPSIKVGESYNVYEYGPFGSMCEMYEMESSVDRDKTGKNKPRLLFVYKDRSKKGKLVTPIFWDEGLSIKGEKIEYEDKDYDEKQKYVTYQYSASLSNLWKQVLAGGKLKFERKKR